LLPAASLFLACAPTRAGKHARFLAAHPEGCVRAIRPRSASRSGDRAPLFPHAVDGDLPCQGRARLRLRAVPPTIPRRAGGRRCYRKLVAAIRGEDHNLFSSCGARGTPCLLAGARRPPLGALRWFSHDIHASRINRRRSPTEYSATPRRQKYLSVRALFGAFYFRSFFVHAHFSEPKAARGGGNQRGRILAGKRRNPILFTLRAILSCIEMLKMM